MPQGNKPNGVLALRSQGVDESDPCRGGDAGRRGVCSFCSDNCRGKGCGATNASTIKAENSRMSLENACVSIPVGIVVERCKANSPWSEFVWRPVAVLVAFRMRTR